MCTVLQHGLARLIGVGQRRGVDVDHLLVALARGAGIYTLVFEPPENAQDGRCRDEECVF
ncbi:MAG TPA: hypothetical protein VGT40_00500 [Methylomirabilota bacterium]|nr:hypothetical protein [Methylomirabilota bacterium]